MNRRGTARTSERFLGDSYIEHVHTTKTFAGKLYVVC